MSTATTKFDDALDFMPATTKTGGRGPLEQIRLAWSAISEGLEAQGRYQRNLAKGMTSTEAASLAFDDTFGNR